jgi:hypothetical protein
MRDQWRLLSAFLLPREMEEYASGDCLSIVTILNPEADDRNPLAAAIGGPASHKIQ